MDAQKCLTCSLTFGLPESNNITCNSSDLTHVIHNRESNTRVSPLTEQTKNRTLEAEHISTDVHASDASEKSPPTVIANFLETRSQASEHARETTQTPLTRPSSTARMTSPPTFPLTKHSSGASSGYSQGTAQPPLTSLDVDSTAQISKESPPSQQDSQGSEQNSTPEDFSASCVPDTRSCQLSRSNNTTASKCEQSITSTDTLRRKIKASTPRQKTLNTKRTRWSIRIFINESKIDALECSLPRTVRLDEQTPQCTNLSSGISSKSNQWTAQSSLRSQDIDGTARISREYPLCQQDSQQNLNNMPEEYFASCDCLDYPKKRTCSLPRSDSISASKRELTIPPSTHNWQTGASTSSKKSNRRRGPRPRSYSGSDSCDYLPPRHLRRTLLPTRSSRLTRLKSSLTDQKTKSSSLKCNANSRNKWEQSDIPNSPGSASNRKKWRRYKRISYQPKNEKHSKDPTQCSVPMSPVLSIKSEDSYPSTSSETTPNYSDEEKSASTPNGNKSLVAIAGRVPITLLRQCELLDQSDTKEMLQHAFQGSKTLPKSEPDHSTRDELSDLQSSPETKPNKLNEEQSVIMPAAYSGNIGLTKQMPVVLSRKLPAQQSSSTLPLTSPAHLLKPKSPKLLSSRLLRYNGLPGRVPIVLLRRCEQLILPKKEATDPPSDMSNKENMESKRCPTFDALPGLSFQGSRALPKPEPDHSTRHEHSDLQSSPETNPKNLDERQSVIMPAAYSGNVGSTRQMPVVLLRRCQLPVQQSSSTLPLTSPAHLLSPRSSHLLSSLLLRYNGLPGRVPVVLLRRCEQLVLPKKEAMDPPCDIPIKKNIELRPCPTFDVPLFGDPIHWRSRFHDLWSALSSAGSSLQSSAQATVLAELEQTTSRRKVWNRAQLRNRVVTMRSPSRRRVLRNALYSEPKQSIANVKPFSEPPGLEV